MVGANLFCQFFIGKLRVLAACISDTSERVRDVIFMMAARVARYFEAFFIMVAKDRAECTCSRMLSKVRGYIADNQTSIWITTIVMGSAGRSSDRFSTALPPVMPCILLFR